MNKTKILGGLVVILLGLNLFLIFSKPPHHRENPKEVIIKKLELSEPQIQEYELLITKHRKDIHALDEEIRENKKELYQLLIVDGDASEKANFLIQENGRLSQAIEKAHFAHFKAIKYLCNEPQKEKFTQLTKELSRIFAPPSQGPKK